MAQVSSSEVYKIIFPGSLGGNKQDARESCFQFIAINLNHFYILTTHLCKCYSLFVIVIEWDIELCKVHLYTFTYFTKPRG